MINIYWQNKFIVKDENLISNPNECVGSFETIEEALSFVNSKPSVYYRIVKMVCGYEIICTTKFGFPTKAQAEQALAHTLEAVQQIENQFGIGELSG